MKPLSPQRSSSPSTEASLSLRGDRNLLPWHTLTLTNPGRVLKTLLMVYYAYILEYRAEIILWVLSGCLPLILLGVWQQVGSSGQYSLTSIEFVRYFLGVFLTKQLTVVWVIWEVEREVVEGVLSFRLLQPMDPVWHHLMQHVAERLTRIPFIMLLVGFFFSLYPEAWFIPSLGQISLFLVSVSLAFILLFILQYTFAMATFWIERATAIDQTWFLFYMFLSGLTAPLDVFPAALVHVLYWTPLPYLIYVPTALLLGLPVPLGQGLAIVLGWILGLLVLNRWLWQQGLKRYSGMGA